MRNSADQTHLILLLFYSAVSLSSSTLWIPLKAGPHDPIGRDCTKCSHYTGRAEKGAPLLRHFPFKPQVPGYPRRAGPHDLIGRDCTKCSHYTGRAEKGAPLLRHFLFKPQVPGYPRRAGPHDPVGRDCTKCSHYTTRSQSL